MSWFSRSSSSFVRANVLVVVSTNANDTLLILHHPLDINGSLVGVDGTKQHIHVLQCTSPGLSDEEEDEEEVSETEASEHDKGLPAKMIDGTGSDLGNDKVERPLGGGSQSDTVGTETGGENLGHVDPRSRTPGSRIADDVEIDHDDHGNGGGRNDVDVCGRVGVKNGANDVHHGHHPESTSEQSFPSPDLLNTNQKEDSGRDHLHGTVDTSGEEGSVGFGNTDSFENLWCVVPNTVGARELLAEHDHEGKEESDADTWLKAFLPCEHMTVSYLSAVLKRRALHVTPSVRCSSSSTAARISANSCRTSVSVGSEQRM